MSVEPWELIEHAVGKLRFRAAHASAAPWSFDKQSDESGVRLAILDAEGNALIEDPRFLQDGRWVALMNPAVGRLLADFMEQTARYMRFESGAVSGKESPYFEQKYGPLVEMARQILDNPA